MINATDMSNAHSQSLNLETEADIGRKVRQYQRDDLKERRIK